MNSLSSYIVYFWLLPVLVSLALPLLLSTVWLPYNMIAVRVSAGRSRQGNRVSQPFRK